VLHQRARLIVRDSTQGQNISIYRSSFDCKQSEHFDVYATKILPTVCSRIVQSFEEKVELKYSIMRTTNSLRNMAILDKNPDFSDRES
jgi:hypothetical protein